MNESSPQSCHMSTWTRWWSSRTKPTAATHSRLLSGDSYYQQPLDGGVVLLMLFGLQRLADICLLQTGRSSSDDPCVSCPGFCFPPRFSWVRDYEGYEFLEGFKTCSCNQHWVKVEVFHLWILQSNTNSPCERAYILGLSGRLKRTTENNTNTNRGPWSFSEWWLGCS